MTTYEILMIMLTCLTLIISLLTLVVRLLLIIIDKNEKKVTTSLLGKVWGSYLPKINPRTAAYWLFLLSFLL